MSENYEVKNRLRGIARSLQELEYSRVLGKRFDRDLMDAQYVLVLVAKNLLIDVIDYEMLGKAICKEEE